MILSRLRLINFRNYEQADVRFSPGLNVLFGKNAQGKTNILEAIHICANGQSFRVRSDAGTVMDGRDGAYIYAEYEDEISRSTEVLIGRDRRKSLKIDGVPARSIKELLGNLYVVVFSPEDMRMAREAPSLRRSFLDGEISKIRPSYVDALRQYSKIIAQKNAALKKRGDRHMKEVLEAYNAQLVGYMKIILKNRRTYAAKLNDYVGRTHADIAGGGEDISVVYRETLNGQDAAAELERLIRREIDDGVCAAGPHRDDLEIRINGKDVKSYASQGQVRTLMLAMKLACLKILQESTGKTPVLLLDDVFSELDGERRKNLLAATAGIQTFITTADEEEARLFADAQLFRVKRGTITSVRHSR